MPSIRDSEAGSTLPPREYMRLVSGDQPNLEEHFDNVGRQVAGGLERLEMLEPGARLLDIGCGCGRVARHLVDSPIAAYVGFDRHAGMIEWAQSHIGARDTRFRFQHVDVQSGYTKVDSNEGSVSTADSSFLTTTGRSPARSPFRCSPTSIFQRQGTT
jgi:SAM-dependent methyltransferase